MRNESLRVECHYQWLCAEYISEYKVHISLYQFYYRKGNFFFYFSSTSLFEFYSVRICHGCCYELSFFLRFFYAHRACAKKCFFTSYKLHSLVNLLLDFMFLIFFARVWSQGNLQHHEFVLWEICWVTQNEERFQNSHEMWANKFHTIKNNHDRIKYDDNVSVDLACISVNFCKCIRTKENFFLLSRKIGAE
jgi:hypothetical protein